MRASTIGLRYDRHDAVSYVHKVMLRGLTQIERKAVRKLLKASSGFTTLLVAALAFSGCSKAPDAPAKSSAPAPTAASAASGAPDTSDDYCKLIPAEQVAEYVRLHDVFTSSPDLTPEFEKGKLFANGETMSFKWRKPDSGPLFIEITLLRRCSVATITSQTLYETAPGSGVIANQLHTSNAGSAYESGTPGVVRVLSTEVDTKTMTGKTTTLGEYSIRLEGPRD